MNRLAGYSILAGAAFLVAVTAHAAAPASCAPSGGLNYICGLTNPEDLVLIPGTRLMISSSMTPGGGLHLVDTEKKTAAPLFPAAAKIALDKTAFPNCPGPLDASKAAFHGLALRATQGKHYRLYSSQHGMRESIEVFDVDATGTTPSLTWIGCQPMPDQHPANSVAALADGTILATVLVMPGKTFADSLAGKNTGAVFQWKPGSKAFQMIPGTELPSNNGIDVSADGGEIYVASSGLRQIVVFNRESPAKVLRRGQIKDFTPDNVHWTADGKLIAAGMVDDEPACGGKPKADAKGGNSLGECPRGSMASTMDPKTMQETVVTRGPATPDYNGAATAVIVGNEIWISSFHANRLAYKPLGK
jgi:hypothetical protein